jgi:predicted phosphohydrolase
MQVMQKELIIVAISDTHQLHREMDVPYGDILLFAGDLTMFSRSTAAIHDFNTWLGGLPHPHKYLVYGNHELFFEVNPARRKVLTNATVLHNESAEVMGMHIWGSPITPLFGGSFGLSNPVDRVKLYNTIPAETDILITHGPPFGILDCAHGTSNHQGDRELLEAVQRIKPRLHVFGHIHGARGMEVTEDTLFVNAAQLTHDGHLLNKAAVLRIPLG